MYDGPDRDVLYRLRWLAEHDHDALVLLLIAALDRRTVDAVAASV